MAPAEYSSVFAIFSLFSLTHHHIDAVQLVGDDGRLLAGNISGN